jgi:RHS repeat-associated protein
VLAGLAEAVPRTVRAEVASTLGLSAGTLFDPPAPPVPSGADPPYPLNHTLDGDPTVLGQPQNADFETEPGAVGSPPTNYDLETAPIDVVTVPNGGFETGTFSDWTLTGTPTIESDQTHGYWARMGSGGQEITSAALAIPQSAQSLVADVYFQGGSSWVEVYALSGPNFETSTQLMYEYCSNCGWQTRFVNLTAYRGQTIKVRFRARYSPVGIDAAKVQQVFPGYDTFGTHAREAAGSDHHVKLNQAAWIATDPFTLDDSAQFGTVEVAKSSSTSQYAVAIATGPSYSTWTTLASGWAPASWQTVTFNLAAYAGQQVKIRVNSTYKVTLFDDILANQTSDIPHWTPSGTTSRITDGSNHYVSNNGSMTSAATQIPAGTQNASFRLRSSSGSNTAVTIDLLRGPGFAEVVQLDYLAVPPTWTTVKVGLVTYAGETVKLRITKQLANPAFHLDDAGVYERVIAGWAPTSLDPLDVGEDAYGTFAKPYNAGGALFLRSSPVSPGIIDRPNKVDSRYYAISYALEPGGLLQVFWLDEQGGSVTAYQDASSPATGYRTRYFPVYDFMGEGSFKIKLTGGSRAYSLGDNVARQFLTEPFSRKVGLGIDTTTGTTTFSETDLSVPGSFPLSFTRSYNAHSDRLGSLGYRWSHTYDTHLEFADEDVGVVFGSGREEFFEDEPGGFEPVDARIHSSLVENGDGRFTLTTKDNIDYDFTATGSLTKISDLNANALELAYDGQGRLSTVTGEGGVTLGLGYDGSGRLTSLTDPAGSVYAFGYDAAGDLVTATDPEGGVRTYTYSRHRLLTVTDEQGSLVVDNAYDQVNRLVSQTDAEKETIQVAYETPAKGATEVAFPGGGTAGFYFDAHHRTTTTVDPSDRQTSFLYDSVGNLDTIIDSGSNAWDYAFDASGDLTEATDPLGNPASFAYNAKHLPTSVTDARGNTTTFTYDADGNLLSATDPLGGVTTNTYDASGNLLSTTDPLGRATTYTYNAKGLQTSKTDPLGKTWTFTYTPLGKLASETDPLGGATTYGYDLLGRLTGITDPLDRETTFLYDLVGHLLAVEDPAGNQTTWDYDDRGLVEAKTDAAGNITTYSYDEARRMTSATNAEGETTTYGYDEAGRLTSITDPLGNATAYGYDAEGRLALKTDPLDRQTAYAYDDAGRLATLTQPNGAGVAYAYDPDGNLTSTTDELDRTTTSGYDELSRLVSVTDPLGNQTTYGFDAASQMTSVTDPLGNETTYGYDLAGQMTSVTDPLGNQTTYGFDDAGRRTSVTDPTDRTTTYGYDPAEQLTSVTDPGGNTTESAFDPAGNLVSTTTPEGHATAYVYDPRGLLTSVTDPLLRVTSYAYDDAGRMLTETDPTGAVTSYGYDDAGRLTTLTDDLGGTVGFGYDAAGQMTSTTDPNGNTWNYAHNALGLRTGVTDPLDRQTVFAYDDAGQLTSRTDGRGITTSYGYDLAGQLTSETFPGGSVSITYDDAGRRSQMVDATGTTTFAYDDAGRTTQVASPEGTIAYGYDEAGRRASMTLPGAKTVSYAYAPAGLLSSLTDWRNETTTFDYDSDGNRTEISRPNGVVSTYTHDAAGHVTDISHVRNAQELLGFAYTYDAAGRPTSVTSAEGAESYAYDDLGRLTTASYPDGLDVSYTYDPAGNRLSETRDGQTTAYTYDDAGQLVSVGGTSYTYDDAGNLLQVGADTYSWDHDSRLLSADVGPHSADYTYDGDGIRVGSEVDSSTSSFLVDRLGGLPTVVDDGSKSFVHADGLLESVSGQQGNYALADRLGSIRGLTANAGGLDGTASYEAFGSPRAPTGTQGLFGFTGEPTDATGLVYLRKRSLDPTTGRILSADSVIPNAPGTQGYSLYAYVANNPTTWADPTGHNAAVVETEIALERFISLLISRVQSGGAIALAAAAAAFQSIAAEAAVSSPAIGAIAAAILGIAFLAAFLYVYTLWLRMHFQGLTTSGSSSQEGQTEWSQEELEEARRKWPTDPLPPIPEPRPCLPDGEVAGGGVTPRDLYATGNAAGPTVRPKDLGVDTREEDVCPGSDPETGLLWGASAFGNEGDLVTHGKVWFLPAGSSLPPDLAVAQDGKEYGGGAETSHHTIQSTRTMPFTEFLSLYRGLNWTFTGRTL